MARTCLKPRLELTEEQLKELTRISQSNKLPFKEVNRAKVLLLYYQRNSITKIKAATGISRESIYKYISKALAVGSSEALKDKYHRPKKPVITPEAELWVINLACTKPKEHGYPEEIWSLSKLAKHTRKFAPEYGHVCLTKAAKATIQRILKKHPLKPHKIKYYLEKRDPEFDKKMKEILIIYQEINIQKEQPEKENKVITVSVDEKPSIQAIKNIAPDLSPKPVQYPEIARDYEYKRLGTLSLLAGLDLHIGHIFGQVQDQHRSKEFIELLKEIDQYYPLDYIIRLILDNHSSHISKETMKYLSTRPNRFVFVHTPKHGSWLNLVESLFSKMTRTVLKHIRVESKDELKQRILQWIADSNLEPVVFKWKKFDFAQ